MCRSRRGEHPNIYTFESSIINFNQRTRAHTCIRDASKHGELETMLAYRNPQPPLPGKPPLRYGLLGNSLKITRIIQSGAILSFFFFQPEMYEEQW